MNHPFIGMGPSPDGIDIPLGLSMELSVHPQAAAAFGKMSPDEKQAAIRYVQAGSTGEEAKQRIQNAIHQLESGQTTIA